MMDGRAWWCVCMCGLGMWAEDLGWGCGLGMWAGDVGWGLRGMVWGEIRKEEKKGGRGAACATLTRTGPLFPKKRPTHKL